MKGGYIANVDARDEATAEIQQWMLDRIPVSQVPASIRRRGCAPRLTVSNRAD